MDCVLPSHAVKTFCSSITTLSRIGKDDLYLEFDPIDGLVLHTLNDAKSAYACFRFRSTFFERCTSPPETLSQQRQRNRSSGSKRTLENLQSQNGEDDIDDGKFLCRVPFRALAPVVRPRKGVVSLQIRSEIALLNDIGQTNNNQSIRSFLSFEFQMQSVDTILSVTHRVQIANETSCQRAVAPKDNASELVASPSVWLRLLEPVVQRTNEVALIVRNRSGENGASSISASSFHHSTDTNQGIQQQRGSHSATNNAIVQAARASLIKTETEMGCNELDEFDFVSNREIERNMPEDVNDYVILVFCLKEAKAILQFCASTQSASSNSYANFLDQPEQSVSLSFHWGGKPLVIETTALSANGCADPSATPFSATLILATLDHSLLISERTIAEPVGAQTSAGAATRSSHSVGENSNSSRSTREVTAAG